MILNELKQILQGIKDNCQERKMCSGCKFWIDGVCILKDMPEKWELDEIDTEEDVKYIVSVGDRDFVFDNMTEARVFADAAYYHIDKESRHNDVTIDIRR